MKTLLVGLIVVVLIGCNSKPEFTRQELIDQKLKVKLERYENNLLDKCYEKTLAEARLYVDSLVSAELSFADSLRYPSRPVRPLRPNKKENPPEIEAKPIFDK